MSSNVRTQGMEFQVLWDEQYDLIAMRGSFKVASSKAGVQ